ncbi:extracellular solute-binding protein [Vallitalea okinawensis]|uniref:extracellular solute-binding protein n=1 Tax=Vallitalea okinawensis TaxID=2078660 RepID=UPI001A9A6CB7|nr:extracellular solute-binding protein [Vallitalea okinawensis]
MKKVISLILAMIMVMSLFAGCSSDDQSTEKTDSTTKVEGSEAKDKDGDVKEEKRYEISWTAYQKAPTDPDGEMLKYFEDMFNVDIDVWNLEHNKYEEMLNVRLAAGEVPDLFRVRKPDQLLGYVNQGVLAEIPEDTLNQYAPNIVQVTEENAPGFLDFGKVDGKLYGIASVNPTNIFRLPIIYRKDWMEAVGVDKVPETLEEFEDLMYKFAKEDPDGNGINDTYGLSQDGMIAIFGAFGGVPHKDYWIEQDGKAVYTGTMPEMKEAVALLNKWYEDGVLDPEFITGENTGGYWAISHSFVNGRIGMTNKGNFYHWTPEGAFSMVDAEGNEVPTEAGAVYKELMLVQPDAEIVFGQPPVGPTGISGTRQYNRLMNFYGIGVYAAQEEGKMEKILEILDYVSANPDIEVRTTATKGIRGKHWEWVNKDKGEAVTLDEYKDTDYSYEIGANLNMTVPFKPINTQAEWAYEEGFHLNGIESVIQVATPKMNEYSAELKKIREEAYISMIAGDKPLSYFEEFVEKYNAAGGTEVEEEVNEWYTANKK